MAAHTLRFRQIHLDFHTSPEIDGIGERFDAREWKRVLTGAHVDSVTLFAKCHHGWSYHDTDVGKRHPHLAFDLLRKQFDATKSAGINAPIYLSAGVDNLASYEHPEWRVIAPEGRYGGWTTHVFQAGFHSMDFFSPYLDYLCDQIAEVVRLFPDCDGIFLDIIAQAEACSRWGIDFMRSAGLDPESEADRRSACEAALDRYYRLTTDAARSGKNREMPVFHNSGHIPRGKRSILKYFSHLELESLPTGGWGYDHFPLSAKYVSGLGMEFLGMTGKFHTTWGEFGGYKHPNALRYECAAMLAFGAKCSVGDQLHPDGKIDETTYRIIGEAYSEVAAKEPWCRGAEQVFDIGVLSAESENGGGRESGADEGAARAFLESHFLFGVIDREMNFSKFKLLVLPDQIRVDAALHDRLARYLEDGGRILLTGDSGLWADRDQFAFDLGANHEGHSPYSPDFILPAEKYRPAFVASPQVMYLRSRRIRARSAESLGDVFDPYFNRTYRHFCSHQHTPFRPESSGYDCGVRRDGLAYLAHPVFTNYRTFGAVAYREFIANVTRDLLGNSATVAEANLPSTARIALTVQPSERRHVLHFLYAPTVSRGGRMELSGGNKSAIGSGVEVIEELLPLARAKVVLSGLPPIREATLEPGGDPLPIRQTKRRVAVKIPAFECHQMVALHWE